MTEGPGGQDISVAVQQQQSKLPLPPFLQGTAIKFPQNPFGRFTLDAKWLKGRAVSGRSPSILLVGSGPAPASLADSV